MGMNTAMDLAENIDISLEDAIGYHLQGNHYPPVPLSMVQPCIDAIDAYYDLLMITNSKTTYYETSM